MAVIIRSCAICSLRTACFFIAFYTIALAVLLLAANIHDYYQAPDYIVWARITSFVFAVLLFLAGVCLIGGLMKSSRTLHGVWIMIFISFVIYQIASVIWGIYYYSNHYYHPMPISTRGSTLATTIVSGLLIFLNILCLVTVHSYRDTIIGI